MASPAPVTERRTELGEGCRWDDRLGELLWIDIARGHVMRETWTGDRLLPGPRYVLPATVGAVAPLAEADGWLVALGRDLAVLEPDGSVRTLHAEVAPPGTRLNDGACDPVGRFLVGSLGLRQEPGAGALFRVDTDGAVSTLLDGLTISNGLGFSPDGRTLYLNDSGQSLTWAFEYDAATGRLGERRTLRRWHDGEGFPDGLTVDAEGAVWVALYAGSAAVRLSPAGAELERLPLPVQQVTCCCLGGTRLDTVFVTTATEGWSEAERALDPAAGAVFAFPAAAPGLPAARYRGPLRAG